MDFSPYDPPKVSPHELLHILSKVAKENGYGITRLDLSYEIALTTYATSIYQTRYSSKEDFTVQ